MGNSEGLQGTRSGELFNIGANRFEALMAMQRELVEAFQNTQQERLARAMQESQLMSEFAQKVSDAHSISDVMALYQEWISLHRELLTQDGRKFLDDSQKVTNAALRLLCNSAASSDA